jgi:hypothetical protein
MRAAQATEMTHRGGESDPDMKALAVMPRTSRRVAVVITVTPVAKLPIISRNKVGSIGLASRCAMGAALWQVRLSGFRASRGS